MSYFEGIATFPKLQSVFFFAQLWPATREEATGFDRRFLMKRVGEGWMIDAVQERLDGWQRTGL